MGNNVVYGKSLDVHNKDSVLLKKNVSKCPNLNIPTETLQSLDILEYLF